MRPEDSTLFQEIRQQIAERYVELSKLDDTSPGQHVLTAMNHMVKANDALAAAMRFVRRPETRG